MTQDPQFKAPGDKMGGKSLIEVLLEVLSGKSSKVAGAAGPDAGANYTEAMTGQRTYM